MTRVRGEEISLDHLIQGELSSGFSFGFGWGFHILGSPGMRKSLSILQKVFRFFAKLVFFSIRQGSICGFRLPLMRTSDRIARSIGQLCSHWLSKVGVRGFEPPTSRTRTVSSVCVLLTA